MSNGKLHSVWLSVTNILIRGLSVTLRFALSLYVARYMGLSSVGLLGVVTGVAGVMPSLTGLGLNYFISREIVDLPYVVAGQKIRDRLAVTCLMCFMFLAVVLEMRAAGVHFMPEIGGIVLSIVVFEVFSLDIHMSLIGLRLQLLASSLLFVRSALWVIIFISVSYRYPEYRSLSFVFHLWLSALVATFGILFLCFFRWPWRQIMAVPLDAVWLLRTINRSWLIYISDGALAGSIYLDRFIVNGMEGLKITGIYMFFWSIANTSQVLISTSVIQMALPQMVAAYRNADQNRWRAIIFEEGLKVLIAGLILATGSYFLIRLLLPFIHRPELNGYLYFFCLMLIAAIVRMVSDVLNYGLYSRGHDKLYAQSNIIGIFLSTFSTIIALKFFGLYAVGFGMLITSILLLAFRFTFLFGYLIESKVERLT